MQPHPHVCQLPTLRSHLPASGCPCPRHGDAAAARPRVPAAGPGCGGRFAATPAGAYTEVSDVPAGAGQRHAEPCRAVPGSPLPACPWRVLGVSVARCPSPGLAPRAAVLGCVLPAALLPVRAPGVQSHGLGESSSQA